MQVLCLDIEGGFGGSSRSLFESLKHMDRRAVTAEVWCGKAGPVQLRYAELAIPARAMPDMPRHSALPRLSRNMAALAQYGRAWRHAGGFRAALGAAAAQADIVHLNHEALHGLAVWLARLPKRPAVTMHIRTMLMPSLFASWQARRIARAVDGLVFISENEQARFASHLGGVPLPPHRVIYNIAEAEPQAQPHPSVPRDGRLVIASLSNFAWVRGIDRVVDVARALKQLGRRDVLFVLAGDMRLAGSLPGRLGAVARAGGNLKDYAVQEGVADLMLFLGHVTDPERVLAAADLLIKPTREDNPWGRDIIEALAAGRPVLSVGRYDRFVSDGETGYLQAEFDAAALAKRIATLADDRTAIRRMGDAAAARVAALCRGPDRSADLLALWQDAVGRRRG